MLSELMSKDTCAACRYCCSFKSTSLWELPTFPEDVIKKLADDKGFRYTLEKSHDRSFGLFDLNGEYQSANPAEEVPCPFLDRTTGCTLSEKDKPFDCKLWPFRVMRKDGLLLLTISIACPSIMSWELEQLRSYAQEKLKKPVRAYVDEHPYIVKDMMDGYVALIEI